MGMTEKHYNGIGRVIYTHLSSYTSGSPEYNAVKGVCLDIGEWLEVLNENPRYKKTQFVARCQLRTTDESPTDD